MKRKQYIILADIIKTFLEICYQREREHVEAFDISYYIYSIYLEKVEINKAISLFLE